jgi:hypothetical protein
MIVDINVEKISQVSSGMVCAHWQYPATSHEKKLPRAGYDDARNAWPHDKRHRGPPSSLLLRFHWFLGLKAHHQSIHHASLPEYPDTGGATSNAQGYRPNGAIIFAALFFGAQSAEYANQSPAHPPDGDAEASAQRYMKRE